MKRSTQRFALACASTAAVACLLIATARVNADVTISDTEFNNSDWTEQISYNTSPADWTNSVQQYTTGGNPGAFRGQSWTYTNVDGAASATFATTDLDTAQSYDPSTQGAIQTLNFSLDNYIADSMGGSTLKAIAIDAAIEQGGNIYAAGYTIPSNVTWGNLTWSLTAANFIPLSSSGPALPDFSASGAPLHFGYYDSLGIGPGFSPYSLFHAVDNFSVNVVSAVPEPADTLLLAAIPLLMRRRRRA